MPLGDRITRRDGKRRPIGPARPGIPPILALLLAGLTASTASGQSTATITGLITNEAGAPLSGVEVMVENEATGLETQALTNPQGQYHARNLPLGGPYSVTARTIGRRTVQREGFQLNLGDVVRVDFELGAEAVELEGLVIETGGVRDMAVRRIEATNIRGPVLDALPAQGRDFTDLASLDPTFIRTGGRNLSIAGARGTQTEFQIDGMSARRSLSGGTSGQGAYTLSMAAIREFEVTRNEYDVRFGRAAGGINAATRSGTNEFEGQIFAFHVNDALTTEDYQGREPEEFRRTQAGFAAGGPLVRDKVHFFMAYDQQFESTPFINGDIRGPEDEIDFDVASDSIARMIDILQRNYGLQNPERQLGQFTRRPLNQSFFAKVDWQLNDRHVLTLRNNLTRWKDPEFRGGDQRITLLEAKEGSRSIEFQTMASLRSTLSPRVTNEARVQVVRLSRFNEPNTDVPRGFVRIRSDLPNGTVGDTRVQFGGNRLSPSRHQEVQLQLFNATDIQLDNQLITFGTDNMVTLSRSQTSNRQGGLFEFESLAELEAMEPFRYSRVVPTGSDRFVFGAPRASWIGLFAQTEYAASPALTVEAGLRWDTYFFLNTPDRNPQVEESFGLRTDQMPSADLLGFQPRFSVTWDPNRDGSRVFQVGGGAFRAQTLNWTTVNAFFGTGNQFADIQLQGDQVPYPDYLRFRQDQSTVPGLPPGGVAGGSPQLVNVISEDFDMPMVWKGNLSYRHDLGFASVGANAILSWTTNNYGYVDRNLRSDPAFRLPDGRPVLVPASTIDANGRPNVNDARVDPSFGRVFELVDFGSAWNRSLVLDAFVPFEAGAFLSGSYTWNQTQDNISFNCCNPRISNPVPGDHREIEGLRTWSNYDFRHKVVLFGQLPSLWGIRLGARYEGQSGRPFSLVVGSDITGDGQRNNNLAFVFDPSDPSTPPEVAAAMQRVLENPDNVAADYIRENLGRIAERNGGRNPWYNRVDLRASRDFPTLGGQRAEVTVDVFNFLNLLNSDWGAFRSLGSRQTLLRVTGFDEERQDYVYSVNENVGVVRPSGDPYQIQLGFRYFF
jgi:hypothetical protein